jgi:hypothetical protein
MMEIEAMTDAEVMAELQRLQSRFTEDAFDELEMWLKVVAAVLHWTGDPLKQPARTVLAGARQVASKLAIKPPMTETEHFKFPKGRWTK